MSNFSYPDIGYVYYMPDSIFYYYDTNLPFISKYKHYFVIFKMDIDNDLFYSKLLTSQLFTVGASTKKQLERIYKILNTNPDFLDPSYYNNLNESFCFCLNDTFNIIPEKLTDLWVTNEAPTIPVGDILYCTDLSRGKLNNIFKK